MSGLVCDVCGAAAIGVCCSSLGALSLAYCQACADVGAEPYDLTVGMASMIGDRIEDYAPHFHPILFATVVRAGKTAEEFWADVREEMAADKALEASA